MQAGRLHSKVPPRSWGVTARRGGHACASRKTKSPKPRAAHDRAPPKWKAENISWKRKKRRTTLARKPSVKRVLALVKRLEKFVDGEDYYPARNSYRGIVVLGLVSKALTVGRAVCTLVKAGFPGEAFGLSRTLIDVCFTLRYISNSDTEALPKIC